MANPKHKPPTYMDLSSPEKLLISSRRNRVVQMRVEGKTLEAIAEVVSEEYGLPRYNKSRAYEDFTAALSKNNRLSLTEISAYRKLEEMRLDYLWTKLKPALEGGHPQAIDSGVKLCRAKSQLLGLDANKEAVIENSVEAELNSFLDQLKMSMDEPTYTKILQVIAGRTGEIGQEPEEEYL